MDSSGDEVMAVVEESPPEPLEWKFSQVFGERSAGEEVQEGNICDSFIAKCFYSDYMMNCIYSTVCSVANRCFLVNLSLIFLRRKMLSLLYFCTNR